MPSTDDGPQAIGSLARIALDAMLAADPGGVMGVPTGFVDLDRVLGGLHPGVVIAVAGRPCMGSSTLVFNIALNVATRERCAVLVVSPGVAGLTTAERLLRMQAKVAARGHAGSPSEDERARLDHACSELEAVPLSILARPNATLEDVEGAARLLAASRRLGLVVVDDADAFAPPGLSRRLKPLALEYRVPVMIVAGLNRGPESRRDRRPILSDLRTRTSAALDADVVLFLYREDYYSPDARTNPRLAQVILARHPSGRGGSVTLAVSSPFGWFEDGPRDSGLAV